MFAIRSITVGLLAATIIAGPAVATAIADDTPWTPPAPAAADTPWTNPVPAAADDTPWT